MIKTSRFHSIFCSCQTLPLWFCNTSQVTRAHVDDSNGKWVLEGWIRQPMVTGSDRRQQPPFTPWNLGVYDAVVLADKMTGCKGEGCGGA